MGVMWAQGGSMPQERVVFALKLKEGRLTFLIYVFYGGIGHSLRCHMRPLHG